VFEELRMALRLGLGLG